MAVLSWLRAAGEASYRYRTVRTAGVWSPMKFASVADTTPASWTINSGFIGDYDYGAFFYDATNQTRLQMGNAANTRTAPMAVP